MMHDTFVLVAQRKGKLKMLELTPTTRITQVFDMAKGFTTSERLVLAKLLLDSLIVDEAADETDWNNMGLASFEKDWDNPEDAVYDNWREHYAVPAE